MHPRTRLIGSAGLLTTAVAFVLAAAGLTPALEPLAVLAAYLVLGVAGSLIDRTHHDRRTIFLASVVVGLLAILVAWVVTALDFSLQTCGEFPISQTCPGSTSLRATGLQTLAWIAPIGTMFALGASADRWTRRFLGAALFVVLVASVADSAGYPAIAIQGLWIGVLRSLIALALGMGALIYGRAVGLSAAA